MRINGVFYKKSNKVMVHNREFTNLFTDEEIKMFKQKCEKDSLIIDIILQVDENGLYMDAFGIKKG